MGLSAGFTSSLVDAFQALQLLNATKEDGLEDGHLQFRANACEQAAVSELGMRQASVLFRAAIRGFHASAANSDDCQSDERSRDAHWNAETRDGDLKAEALADCSAEKSRGVLVGCYDAHVLATANARVP